MQYQKLPATSPIVLVFLFSFLTTVNLLAQQFDRTGPGMRPMDTGIFSGSVTSANDLAAPKKARSELRKGIDDSRSSRWDEGVKHFQKALLYYPKYDAAYYDLGIAYLQDGHLEKAHKVLTKFIETSPGSYKAQLGIGILRTLEGRFAEAEGYLKKFLVSDPGNIGVLAILSFAQLQEGHYADALATAQKVHHPGHHVFCFSHLVAAEALVHLNRPGEAAAEYRVYLSEEPNSPQATIAREFLKKWDVRAAKAGN